MMSPRRPPQTSMLPNFDERRWRAVYRRSASNHLRQNIGQCSHTTSAIQFIMRSITIPKDGCKALHHILLHGMPRLFPTRGKSNAAAETTIQSNHINTVDRINTDSFVGTTRLCNNVNLLPIVPIKIAGKNGVTIEIFGLLDQGSEVT